MINTPAPGLIGDPRPADDRIPSPAAVIIRVPVVVIVDLGHPDIAGVRLIVPITVFVQLRPVFVELLGKIGA